MSETYTKKEQVIIDFYRGQIEDFAKQVYEYRCEVKEIIKHMDRSFVYIDKRLNKIDEILGINSDLFDNLEESND